MMRIAVLVRLWIPLWKRLWHSSLYVGDDDDDDVDVGSYRLCTKNHCL